jgi:RimJ/RimL family protein N-acetyltransferase
MAIISREMTSAMLDTMPVVEVHEQTPFAQPPAVSTDWRTQLPILGARSVTLRELRLSDAASLFEMLSTEEVERFISPPPTTVEGYEKFILWTQRERAAGRLVCFGVVPEGMTMAVGIIQVRSIEPGFGTAEWGFAIGAQFWGTGVFMAAAHCVLDFAFEHIGVHRMEARAVVYNGRGNGALRKLGATREGVLRSAFLKHGAYHDQFLWTIVDTDWIARPAERSTRH